MHISYLQKQNVVLNIYSVVAFINISLFAIVATYFNKFLFWIYGYDLKLVNKSYVESFQAYRHIGNSKLYILILLLLLSVFTFMWTLKLQNKLRKWLYNCLFVILILIIFVSITLVIFHLIIPTKIL
jgi:hypothetical protein